MCSNRVTHFKRGHPAAQLAMHGHFRAQDAGPVLYLDGWHLGTGGPLPLYIEGAKSEPWQPRFLREAFIYEASVSAARPHTQSGSFLSIYSVSCLKAYKPTVPCQIN